MMYYVTFGMCAFWFVGLAWVCEQIPGANFDTIALCGIWATVTVAASDAASARGE